MTELPYIASSGTQYINTGVYPSNNVDFEIKIRRVGDLSGWGHLIGSINADSSLLYIFGIKSWSETLSRKGSGSIQYNSYSFSPNTDYVIRLSGSDLSINGSTIQTLSGGSFAMDIPLYIFAADYNNVPNSILPSTQLYYAKIWDNGTLIRDFIPAIENGHTGLWDNVSETFYADAAGGEFITPAWYIDESGELTNDKLPNSSSPMTLPYPYSVWRETDNEVSNELMPDVRGVGAFANATQLRKISIPRSVKKIGEYAFRNTQLSSVVISQDCEYYPTSFPDNCIIYFYPD